MGDTTKSIAKRIGSALLGSVLFVLWGSMVAAVAMLGLLVIAGAIWTAFGRGLDHLDLIQMRSLLKGVALGIGFTAAFAHRRRLNRDGLRSALRRPVVAVGLLLLAFGGYAAYDFLRCDLWLFMPNYERFAWREWDSAVQRVEPANLPLDQAMQAMANRLDGREWDANGWRFRLSVSHADPRTEPSGTWYVVGSLDEFVPLREGSDPQGSDSGRLVLVVLVQPRSLGARLSALQFSAEDEWMLFPDWPLD